jgi:hypothetical protein
MSKTYIFYHIYCNENTLPILTDQMTKIIFSGLYNDVNTIYCFITGINVYIEPCINYLSNIGKKITIVDMAENNTEYERFTLLKIPHFINDDDKFLYLHTKGITKPNNSNVTDWRNYMEYFVIGKYKECLQDLVMYDCVGVNWRYCPKPHFSGNFWWTKGSYFNKLPHTIDSDYCAPEFYIGLGSPKIKCLYSTTLDHYYNKFSMKDYID